MQRARFAEYYTRSTNFPRTTSRTRVRPTRTSAPRAFRRLRLARGGVRFFRQLFHGLEELRRLPDE